MDPHTILIIGLILVAAILASIAYACLIAGKLADRRIQQLRIYPPGIPPAEVTQAGYYWLEAPQAPRPHIIRVLIDYDAGAQLVTLDREPITKSLSGCVLHGPIPAPLPRPRPIHSAPREATLIIPPIA